MRKFLVLASVAAVTLNSCNKTDELTSGPSLVSKDISFATYLGHQTKGVSKDAFKMGDQFSAFGVKTALEFDIAAPNFSEYVFTSADKSASMSHFGIDPTSKLPIWNYGNPIPWDDNKATFFAYSPVPQGGVTFGITNPSISDNTIPSIDFEVTGGYATTITDLNDPAVSAARELIKKQADLLWAYSANNTKLGGDIQLDFRHALSQIRFSARCYHTEGLLRLNSITIKNVNTKSTLKLAHDESVTPKLGDINYLGGWKAATEPKNFAINLQTDAVSAIPPTTAGVTPTSWAVTDDDESLMMIPQSLTGLTLDVRYSYSTDGITWQNYESGASMDFTLTNLSSHWNPNKRYNYILNISPGRAVTFDAIIDIWEPTGDADLEYREYDAEPKGGVIADKLGAAEKFILKAGDKIKTTYSVGGATNWLIATDATAGAGFALSGTTITVTAANAGEWTLKANPYDALASEVMRKGTIVIERAPYDKTLADGTTIKVKAGVSKFVIRQGTWVMAANTIVYGRNLGAITTGLSGYTTTGYPNAFSVAYATEALALENQKPFRRFRVALKAANPAPGNFAIANGIAACALYSESGAPAGTWRMMRAGEAKLIGLNRTEINKVAGMTAIDFLISTTYSVIDKTTPANERIWFANASNALVATPLLGSYDYMRCVFEEK